MPRWRPSRAPGQRERAPIRIGDGTASQLARIIYDAHGGWISPASHSPIGCGHARCPSGAGVGLMMRIAGFGIAVEGLDRGDTAPRFR